MEERRRSVGPHSDRESDRQVSRRTPSSSSHGFRRVFCVRAWGRVSTSTRARHDTSSRGLGLECGRRYSVRMRLGPYGALSLLCGRLYVRTRTSFFRLHCGSRNHNTSILYSEMRHWSSSKTHIDRSFSSLVSLRNRRLVWPAHDVQAFVQPLVYFQSPVSLTWLNYHHYTLQPRRSTTVRFFFSSGTAPAAPSRRHHPNSRLPSPPASPDGCCPPRIYPIYPAPLRRRARFGRRGRSNDLRSPPLPL